MGFQKASRKYLAAIYARKFLQCFCSLSLIPLPHRTSNRNPAHRTDRQSCQLHRCCAFSPTRQANRGSAFHAVAALPLHGTRSRRRLSTHTTHASQQSNSGIPENWIDFGIGFLFLKRCSYMCGLFLSLFDLSLLPSSSDVGEFQLYFCLFLFLD